MGPQQLQSYKPYFNDTLIIRMQTREFMIYYLPTINLFDDDQQGSLKLVSLTSANLFSPNLDIKAADNAYLLSSSPLI